MDGGNEAGAVTEAGTGTGIGAGTGAESGAEAGAIGTQSFENGMKAAANESADVDMKETSHQSGGRFMEEDNKNDSDIHDYANGGNNNGSNGNSGDGVVVKEEREGMMDTEYPSTVNATGNSAQHEGISSAAAANNSGTDALPSVASTVATATATATTGESTPAADDAGVAGSSSGAAPIIQPTPHGAPTRVYLNTNVTPFLLEGMKWLALKEPEKPLKWLSEFLAQKSKEIEGT